MIQKDIYEYLRPHSWKQDMINMTHHTEKKCTSVLKVGNQKYIEKNSS